MRSLSVMVPRLVVNEGIMGWMRILFGYLCEYFEDLHILLVHRTLYT